MIIVLFGLLGCVILAIGIVSIASPGYFSYAVARYEGRPIPGMSTGTRRTLQLIGILELLAAAFVFVLLTSHLTGHHRRASQEAIKISSRAKR